MGRKQWRKKLAAAIAAGAIVFSASPTQTANAGILGTLLGAGIQAVQLSKQISYYDGDGREELFQSLQKQHGVNRDPALNARLDAIMANLSASIAQVDPSIEEKPYNYFINNDTSFNAFCTLGHNISVNKGMFDLVANDDEIAVVLGHEMGHGQKNHVKKGVEQTLLVQVGAAVLTNGSAIGSLIANYAGAVHVTKPHEREADKLAFQYITHSGYNPGACAAIWQRVMEQYGEKKGNFLGDIFSPSDHPSHKERRDTYAKSLAAYSGGKVGIDADAAVVTVNGKALVSPAPADGMSSEERAFFVMGNLAAACHDGKDAGRAWADGDILMLGGQPIMASAAGDPSAPELAARLNEIK